VATIGKIRPLGIAGGKEARTPSNVEATAPGRLPFDRVVEVEGAIAGTRDTPLLLKMSSGPQPGGRLSLQGVGTGETSLPLKASPDGSAQHVTTAAFDVSFDQAAFLDQPSPKLSNAVIEGGGVPPAGPAPSEIKLEAHAAESTFAGAGNLAANAEVVRAEKVIAQNLAANTAGNRAGAQALLRATQVKITELRDARLNDPATEDLVEFLEWLAQGLTRLVDNLDRAIAQPAEPLFLGTAGDIAHELKLGLVEAVKKNAVGFGRSAPPSAQDVSLFAEWGKTD